MKLPAILLLASLCLTNLCVAAPKSPQEVVGEFYAQFPNRKGNFELKAEELQNSPSLEAGFKRQLIAQRKGQFKKDGRWLIDFDLLTSLQADRPTGSQAGVAKISGNGATVPLLLNYNDGVRGKPHSLNLQVHLRQMPAGWQIDNVIYPQPELTRHDAQSFLRWAQQGSGAKP